MLIKRLTLFLSFNEESFNMLSPTFGQRQKQSKDRGHILFCSLPVLVLCGCMVTYFIGIQSQTPLFFIVFAAVQYLIVPAIHVFVRNRFLSRPERQEGRWVNFLPFAFCISGIFISAHPQSIKWENFLQKLTIAYPEEHLGRFVEVLLFANCFSIVYGIYQICQLISSSSPFTGHLKNNNSILVFFKAFNILLIIVFSAILVYNSEHVLSAPPLAGSLSCVLTVLVFLLLAFEKPNVNQDTFILDDLFVEHQEYEDKLPCVDCGDDSPCDGKIRALFDVEKRDEYIEKLEMALSNSRPYLIKGISVRSLASLTGIPAHHLSSLINREYNCSFQDFINFRRITYLKANMDCEEWKMLTLEGICWEVGFASRTTFFRAFVKHTGVCPSTYFNEVRSGLQKISPSEDKFVM